MRGPKQQETDEGAEMFAMTRNQFLAIRSMSPAPEKDDYSWLLRQHCGEPYVSRVATLTIACSEIRMKTDKLLSGGHRDPRKIQDVLELLRTAQAMQKKLSSLDQPQSAVWSVSTVIRDSLRHRAEGEEPPGEVYTFHNLYTAMIYTIIWCSHIFLTTCIFRCMAWLVAPDDWRSGEDYEAAVESTKQRIADIVAAVPYCCSWNGSDTEYSDFPVGMSTPASPVKGVAGMVIFRPAFTAMVSDYATPEQKRYLYGRMKFLADIVGIKQANILLKVCLPFSEPCVSGSHICTNSRRRHETSQRLPHAILSEIGRGYRGAGWPVQLLLSLVYHWASSLGLGVPAGFRPAAL